MKCSGLLVVYYGSAILEGVLSNKLLRPEEAVIYDLDQERTKALANKLKISVATDLESLFRSADTVFLCVKPQDMKSLLLTIKDYLTSKHLLVSIAAGLTIDFFEKHLGKLTLLKIIRIMPNTPCLVGEGMIVICKTKCYRRRREK